jgi:hypothetical protein
MRLFAGACHLRHSEASIKDRLPHSSLPQRTEEKNQSHRGRHAACGRSQARLSVEAPLGVFAVPALLLLLLLLLTQHSQKWLTSTANEVGNEKAVIGRVTHKP